MDNVIKYKANRYGGIDIVEIDYRNDSVFINGELADGYEGVGEYLACNDRDLYRDIVACANSMIKR